jgi:hypothetical protein
MNLSEVNHAHRGPLPRAFDGMHPVLVPAFTLLFLGFARLYVYYVGSEIVIPLFQDGDFGEGLFKGLHTCVAALAIHELAEIAHEEYDRRVPLFWLARLTANPA